MSDKNVDYWHGIAFWLKAERDQAIIERDNAREMARTQCPFDCEACNSDDES